MAPFVGAGRPVGAVSSSVAARPRADFGVLVGAVVGGAGAAVAAGPAMVSRTTAGFIDDDVPARVAGRSGGYLWGKSLHKTERWWYEAEVEAIAPGFVNDNGFVPQTRTRIHLER